MESVFDNVKFEKAKAIARYNRFRKFTKVLQFVELFVALILISWSSTKLPMALRVSGNLLFEISGYVFKPHVVFLIGNAIIVAVVVLCRENDGENQKSSDSGDIYDDYLRHNQAAQQPKVSVSNADFKISSETKETTGAAASLDGDGVEEKKQIAVCVRSEDGKTEQCDAILVTAIENATEQIEKFQRTQSAKLRSDISGNPRRQLQRSETERPRAKKDVMTSFDSMDNLSNEDFNLTVDNFIRRMKTPEFLKQQKLLESVD